MRGSAWSRETEWTIDEAGDGVNERKEARTGQDSERLGATIPATRMLWTQRTKYDSDDDNYDDDETGKRIRAAEGLEVHAAGACLKMPATPLTFTEHWHPFTRHASEMAADRTAGLYGTAKII